VAALEARLGEAEERLRAASRLETVGRLVAGVAHDFNNLLTVIAGSAEIIRAELPDGHHLRDGADLIASTVQTAANVARQLVNFSRPTKSDPCPVDANAAIRSVERTLRRLTGERVALDFLPALALPLLFADPGQFDQVLLNLVVNARDAITGDGTVTIRTAVANPGGRAADGPGDFVALTVTDTGAGMTEEVRARVFDPFFTTKAERGTGLGLSTVRDIVRAAGGHLEVESSPGWGTSVRVFWPVFPDPTDTLRLVR
jgi:signal transduction histidine kinase